MTHYRAAVQTFAQYKRYLQNYGARQHSLTALNVTFPKSRAVRRDPLTVIAGAIAACPGIQRSGASVFLLFVAFVEVDKDHKKVLLF